MTAPWLQEALCSTPGAALTPAGPPEHPAGGRRGAPPPARTATPCCHLPPGASTALPASQKPAPRWALGEVIPPEAAKRPRVPFVLRPAVEILVLCTYFCIIISLYNFPLFFIFLFFYYCLLPGEGLKPDFCAPCLPASRSAHLPGIIISTLIFI